jgi:hypothetical protein
MSVAYIKVSGVFRRVSLGAFLLEQFHYGCIADLGTKCMHPP